jgi:hypothetical protein
MIQEFDRAPRLRPLYERIKAGAERTADGKLALYLILRACATQAGGANGENRGAAIRGRIKALADGISDTDPDKSRRLQVLNDLKGRCEGFEGVSTTPSELQELLGRSAAEGNPSARVRLLEQELRTSSPSGESPALTDAQLATLREALGSKDPNAIFEAGTILSNTFRDLVVESATTHQPLEGNAAHEAWRLLACEYGMECGPSNIQLRVECALAGQCEASNIPDLVFFYHVSPYQAQLIDQYRNTFRAIVDRDDWSGLTLVRRPNDDPGARYFFGIP